jgi:hypothetical protein
MKCDKLNKPKNIKILRIENRAKKVSVLRGMSRRVGKSDL